MTVSQGNTQQGYGPDHCKEFTNRHREAFTILNEQSDNIINKLLMSSVFLSSGIAHIHFLVNIFAVIFLLFTKFEYL